MFFYKNLFKPLIVVRRSTRATLSLSQQFVFWKTSDYKTSARVLRGAALDLPLLTSSALIFFKCFFKNFCITFFYFFLNFDFLKFLFTDVTQFIFIISTIFLNMIFLIFFYPFINNIFNFSCIFFNVFNFLRTL